MCIWCNGLGEEVIRLYKNQQLLVYEKDYRRRSFDGYDEM